MNVVVQPGDTLYSIAAQYGVSVPALMQANGMERPTPLEAGQTLLIPWPLPAPTPLPTTVPRAGGQQERRVDLLEERNIALQLEIQLLKKRVSQLEQEMNRLRGRMTRQELRIDRLPPSTR
ncbi:LysM peptidoglycan-binding domain-containing protein [Paenibacillus sp. HJGM_3]|uniref:LysM peptidoglycan-binding domain-containing protein n=1 Tax=Paenibacillus sp. HJGM_3 TaxID=3379816 RepID=UPI00385E735B